jgi:serine/threonine protein kinase
MTVDRIGRYEVVEQLAVGGMGIIFLARDPYIQRQVVIKVLMYTQTLDPMHRELFQREAEVIAALEHPYIVPVYDFGWHGQQPFIVMRYMAGGTLEQRIKRGDVKLTEMAQIFKRVAEALDAAHHRQIVHRDVKPSNILFDVNGDAFLSDFGIAKLLITNSDEQWVMGTPAYMSPEQATGENMDGRSDLYSLGIVLYEILTGQLPFSAGTATGLIRARLTMPIPDIRSLQSNVPAVWQEVVGKALARDSADRYQSVVEFAQDVTEVVSGRWYLRRL